MSDGELDLIELRLMDIIFHSDKSMDLNLINSAKSLAKSSSLKKTMNSEANSAMAIERMYADKNRLDQLANKAAFSAIQSFNDLPKEYFDSSGAFSAYSKWKEDIEKLVEFEKNGNFSKWNEDLEKLVELEKNNIFFKSNRGFLELSRTLSSFTSAASLADYINDSIAPSILDSIRNQSSLIEGLNDASNSFLLLKDMLKVADYGSIHNDRDRFDLIIEPDSEYNEVEVIADSLSVVSNSNGFIDVFKSLNPHIQTIIIYIVLSFLDSQINNLISYHINKGLDNIYSNEALSTKEKVHKTKNIVWEIEEAQLSNFRFITGDNVRLREDSSTKSEVLDELVLGQVVEVHSKKKNWIEVSYQYEDGTYMNGWVFTRYTARFVK